MAKIGWLLLGHQVNSDDNFHYSQHQVLKVVYEKGSKLPSVTTD